MTDDGFVGKICPRFEGLGFGVLHLKHADVGDGVTVVKAVSAQGTFQLKKPNLAFNLESNFWAPSNDGNKAINYGW